MKIKRDAFLYMAPRGDHARFAQCETCREFLPTRQWCAILDLAVKPNDTCGLYFYGKPSDDHKACRSTTPKEVGLLRDEQVRCENCVSFNGKDDCALFRRLNTAMPTIFDCDTTVEGKGCCNGWTPKPHHRADGGAVISLGGRAALLAKKMAETV